MQIYLRYAETCQLRMASKTCVLPMIYGALPIGHMCNMHTLSRSATSKTSARIYMPENLMQRSERTDRRMVVTGRAPPPAVRPPSSSTTMPSAQAATAVSPHPYHLLLAARDHQGHHQHRFQLPCSALCQPRPSPLPPPLRPGRSTSLILSCQAKPDFFETLTALPSIERTKSTLLSACSAFVCAGDGEYGHTSDASRA